MNPLREDHEELYGALLAADQSIEDAGGCWLLCSAVLVAVGSILGIEVGILDGLLGLDLDRLRHWGVYLGIAVVTFFSFAGLVMLSERMAYHRARDEIHEQVQRIGLSWNALLSRTAGDPDLKNVVEQLRKDKGRP